MDANDSVYIDGGEPSKPLTGSGIRIFDHPGGAIDVDLRRIKAAPRSRSAAMMKAVVHIAPPEVWHSSRSPSRDKSRANRLRD